MHATSAHHRTDAGGLRQAGQTLLVVATALVVPLALAAATGTIPWRGAMLAGALIFGTLWLAVGFRVHRLHSDHRLPDVERSGRESDSMETGPLAGSGNRRS